MQEEPAKRETRNFRVLVCIDGSDESYRGLTYAARLGQGVSADIHLLYVRPVDQGLSSGGLQVRVARENMQAWGLDIPGVRYLKKGRDLLVEMGHMSAEWEESFTHNDIHGDPLGAHELEYKSASGKEIRLILHPGTDAASGILDCQEKGQYDLVILGGSGRRRSMTKYLGIAPVAVKVAVHAPCSVLVTRELESGGGHLICVDGSEISLAALKRDAVMANRCMCPIALISVARNAAELPQARENVRAAEATLNAMNIDVHKRFTPVGDPVAEIVEAGRESSVIALSDTAHSGVRRFFMGGVSFSVLEHAGESVMVIR